MGSTVEIIEEREGPRGWAYDARVRRGDAERLLELSLAFVDHDHWSGGRVPPSRVAQRLLEVLLELDPGIDLPGRFDASTARRWAPALDERMLMEFGA